MVQLYWNGLQLMRKMEKYLCQSSSGVISKWSESNPKQLAIERLLMNQIDTQTFSRHSNTSVTIFAVDFFDWSSSFSGCYSLLFLHLKTHCSMLMELICQKWSFALSLFSWFYNDQLVFYRATLLLAPKPWAHEYILQVKSVTWRQFYCSVYFKWREHFYASPAHKMHLAEKN